MAELKKCPFCGGEAKETLILGRDGVSCVECGAMFRAEWEEEAKDVVNRWNNRATEAEIRAKAIDEFAEKLCDVFSEEYGEVTVNGIKFDVLTLDGATEITWDVAEQLKEE